jgi:translation initiation factor IF-2
MAKKRVHELAKLYDLPSAEVMKRLTAYGLTVKAAASAVDEDEADRALKGLPPKAPEPETNGKPEEAPKRTRPPRRVVTGNGAPPVPGAKPPAPKPEAKAPRPTRDESASQPGANQAAGRRTRDSLQGERAPGAQGGVRRVVIDSQAARRGPGGPGGGPGPSNQPTRRPGGRGRRRRRGDFYEIEDARREAREAAEAARGNQDLARIPSGSTVKDVAEYIDVPVPEIIKKLMQLGEMATLTQTLTDETIEVLAAEFEREVEITHGGDEADADPVFEDSDEDLVDRSPVITIMGHVDHGKTSLLDAIRSTEVAVGEAGGITQHIGAYQVHHGDKLITFLDTPGHEAFTAMRARGAQVTDIAVIVVAADDGVKPQTREAVDHANAAGVPILVAVNKIDKEGAQPDRVRTEMTQLGLQPEEWGGETIFVDVSAKAKTNLDDLLDSLLLVAEVAELKANPAAEASGVVVESKLDPGRGAVVTVLVQRGTMRVGDAVVAGAHWGRVRAMHDYLGKRVKEAGPSEPVEVLGFDSVPEAGEFVTAVENDRKARQLANERAVRVKQEQQARRMGGKRRTLESFFDAQSDREVKELNLVLKADVSGSLEAFEDEIARLPQEEVAVSIVSSGVGGITESDVMLAAASDAVVIGFNVRPVGEARLVADREDVEIRSYSIIYKALEDLRDAMEGMLDADEVEDTVGAVEIRATFKASKIGTIAGCYVTEGKVTRGAKVRLLRDGVVVWDGEIDSLRRGSDDVREVATGFECGIVLKDYQDVKEGDELEVYETRQVERTLA